MANVGNVFMAFRKKLLARDGVGALVCIFRERWPGIRFDAKNGPTNIDRGLVSFSFATVPCGPGVNDGQVDEYDVDDAIAEAAPVVCQIGTQVEDERGGDEPERPKGGEEQ